jgi:hypothetical protein
MQSAGFDIHNTKQSTTYERVNTKALQRSYAALVLFVIETYARIKECPPICALDPHPQPVTRSMSWRPDLANFTVDVESATSDALQDHPELQSAWFGLAAGNETVPEDIARQVVFRCGRYYRARGLHPADYFRPTVHRESARANPRYLHRAKI